MVLQALPTQGTTRHSIACGPVRPERVDRGEPLEAIDRGVLLREVPLPAVQLGLIRTLSPRERHLLEPTARCSPARLPRAPSPLLLPGPACRAMRAAHAHCPPIMHHPPAARRKRAHARVSPANSHSSSVGSRRPAQLQYLCRQACAECTGAPSHARGAPTRIGANRRHRGTVTACTRACVRARVRIRRVSVACGAVRCAHCTASFHEMCTAGSAFRAVISDPCTAPRPRRARVNGYGWRVLGRNTRTLIASVLLEGVGLS
jgi:hypothetical protein